MQWLSGTILTGLCGAALIGGAVFASLDGEMTFAKLPERVEGALRGAFSATDHQASWAGAVLTLSFASGMEFATAYTISIDSSAVDEGGGHLAPFTASFTTVAAGLKPIATVPAPNVAGASIRSPIAIIFDGAVDPVSVADSLRITPSASGARFA